MQNVRAVRFPATRSRANARWLLGVGLAIAQLQPTSAWADSEPVRIEYRAHASCPSRDDFLAELFSRTARARLALPDEKGRTFRASITELENASSGRLEIVELTGRSSARVLEGETCAEVMSALALTAALAIDPEASLEPKPKPRSSPDAGKTGDQSATTPPLVARRPSAQKETKRAPSPSRPETTDDRWTRSLGGGLFMTSLIAPELAPGVQLFFGVQNENTAIKPSLRVVGRYARSSQIETNAGDGKFQWGAGRLELCLPQLALGQSLTASPGVGFEGGALHAAGSATVAPRQITRLWLAASVLARAGMKIGGGTSIQLQAELTLPFTRDTFVFDDPATVVHDVPSAGGLAGVGIEFQLP